MPRFLSQPFSFLTAAAFLGCCLFLASCATMPDWSGHGDEFETAQLEYAQMVRWGNFDKAAGWVERESAEAFLKGAADAADLRFTDYEVVRKNMDATDWTAQVTVRYEVHRANELISTTFLEKQTWKYNETARHWEVNTNLFEAIEAAFHK